MTLQTKKKISPRKKRTERYDIGSSHLYGIRSHARLAKILWWAGTEGQLRSFSRRVENYNRYIEKGKLGKKDRPIEAPDARLKGFQKRLLDLLSRIKLPEYLHSARLGYSYLSNSAAHCEAYGCTITMDIDSFYQSVKVQHVSRFFETSLGCSSDVSQTLANLCCCDGHLATGSPLSPLISFWIFKDMFDAVNHKVKSRDGVFTLYIDDMGITGKGFGHTDVLWIARLLRKSGLTVKESKTRVFHADAPKLITGRACRNSVSRAPNKQHRRMRDAQLKLARNPNDPGLRASVAGLMRHLGLLDDKNRDLHRREARLILKGS